jgi:hypothetical protein
MAADDLLARIVACDPARELTVDETARRELWRQLASQRAAPSSSSSRRGSS